MYPKAFLVALLSLSLSVGAIPTKGQSSKDETCGTGVSTITVTETAAASQTSTVLAAPPSKSSSASKSSSSGKSGSSGSKSSSSSGKGGDNAGSGGAAAGTTTSSASTSTSTSIGTGVSSASLAAQSSLTIDPSNLFTGYEQDGQANATAGQEPSQTSSNNFINFCLLFPDKAKTNGQQVVNGSCNQTPMGVIAAQANMPSSKFVFPSNGELIAANTNFTIQMAISNLETGHFTNAATTFHMAPQVVNDQGLIKGHSHVVIEALTSVNQTTPTDPTKFVFFKGINDAAVNGVLSAEVPGGLPAGSYRIASINSAANHQPALVAVAQRGALDDMVYFTVSDNGGDDAASGAAAASSTTAAAAAATSSAAAGKKSNPGPIKSTPGKKGQGKNRRAF